jgi:hypothetical protein
VVCILDSLTGLILVPWWYVCPYSTSTTQHFDLHRMSTPCFVCCNILLLSHFGPIMFYRDQHFVPVTFYYWNISSLQHFTILRFCLCNVFLLRLFDPVMCYYCKILTSIWYVQETDVHSASQLESYCCVRTSSFLPGLWQNVHFCFEAKCGLFVNCHRGIRQGVFSLVGRGRQNVTIVKYSRWFCHGNSHWGEQFNLPFQV